LRDPRIIAEALAAVWAHLASRMILSFAAARHDEPGRIGAGLASDPDAAQRIIVARAWFPSTRSICSAAPWCSASVIDPD
jgi:hypothetical protein